MTKELLRQHFQYAGFDNMQADALAAYFDLVRGEMATRRDLEGLRTEMAALRSELMGAQVSLRNEIKAEMRAELVQLKADLTWRFVALVVFLGTVLTAADVYLS